MRTLQLPDTKQTNQTLTNIQNNKDFRFFYSKIILLKEESLGLQTYSRCRVRKSLPIFIITEPLSRVFFKK